MGIIDLFRCIDFWVGIPLCLLLSPIAYLRRWWLRLFARGPVVPKKILVIKLAELGAVVQAYPFFKKIEEDYPQAKVYVLTFAKNMEIFELFDGFLKDKEVITISEEGVVPMVKDIGRVLWKLLFLKIDVTIDLEFFARASSLMTFFSWAKKAVGFYAYGYEGLYRGNFLTHKVAYNPLKHVTVNYLSLAAAIRLAAKDSPEVEYNIDSAAISFPVYRSREDVRVSLSPLEIPSDKWIFLMNAGEGNIPLREWPIENFKQTAQAILKDERHVLLLVGTSGAREKAEQLMAQLNHKRMRNYCGQTSLKQLMEIFLMSHALIVNDGGLGHLAILTPIKKYVLFGPESPQIFAPLSKSTKVFYSHWPCSPCLSAFNHRKSACRDNLCLKAIKVSDIVDEIRKGLQEGDHG